MKTKKELYGCIKCNFVTDNKGKKCPLCSGVLMKSESPEKKRNLASESAKKPGLTLRFPRILSEAEKERKVIARQIEELCRDLACSGKVVDIRVGPILTDYRFEPKRFTRVKRLKTLHEDMAIALHADAVSIARVPGTGLMSIAVPNSERTPVNFQDTLKHLESVRNTMELPLNFGVDSMGKPVVEDLTRMPHLLVAGATGSGKSVFLNCLITSLLHCRNAKQMELVMLDPKEVELSQYSGMPHLRGKPVVKGVYDCLQMLTDTVEEVKHRNYMLQRAGVKNIKEYNDQLSESGKRLPYTVIVIDEMGDLVIQERKEFTTVLARIAAIARAAGIHMIAATQRPSVDVLSGKIKVNFPSRVAFKVPGAGDSKTILTTKGAEQLMSVGDGLFMSPLHHGLQRIHIPMVTDADVNKMKQESLEWGHVERCPADGPKVVNPLVPVVSVMKGGK